MGKSTFITCAKLTHLNGKHKGRSVTCVRDKFFFGTEIDKDYRRRARARARVHNAARRARQRTDACATHRGRAARRFEKALEVSRAQAILFTEDAFNHFWLQDDESKKGTWVCIGSTEVPAQTFPLLTKTNMCLKVGSTTFYIEEPPKVRRRRRCLLARAREREARARERARTRAIRRRRRRRRRARRRIRRKSRAETTTTTTTTTTKARTTTTTMTTTTRRRTTATWWTTSTRTTRAARPSIG